MQLALIASLETGGLDKKKADPKTRFLVRIIKPISALRTGKNDGLLRDRISYVQQRGCHG